jgi:hypothetical protein
MNKSLLLGALTVLAMPVAAEPVDMTGLACRRATTYGMQTWEFYGDVAIRYYEDGSVSRLSRIGHGAYEKYDREGDWISAYLFFDAGDGVHIRILSRPGLIARSENPAAPLEKGVFPFDGPCVQIWKHP